MSNKILKTLVSLFLLFIFFLSGGELSSAEEDGLVIHFNETTYTFPTVFEGEKLTHTFTVFNKGKSELQIKKVRPS